MLDIEKDLCWNKIGLKNECIFCLCFVSLMDRLGDERFIYFYLFFAVSESELIFLGWGHGDIKNLINSFLINENDFF